MFQSVTLGRGPGWGELSLREPKMGPTNCPAGGRKRAGSWLEEQGMEQSRHFGQGNGVPAELPMGMTPGSEQMCRAGGGALTGTGGTWRHGL